MQLQSSHCLDNDTVVALIEQRLTPPELAIIHAHMRICAICQALVRAVLSDLPETEPAAAAHAERAELAPSGSAATRSHPSSLLHMDPKPQSFTPPEEIDEFRILRPLGRGGMGVVYVAHDRSLDRLVAIKFIAAAEPDAEVRAHFITEARAIARLQHPNVVTVHRVGEHVGRPYLVSELILGHNLAEIERPQPWRRVLSMGLALARGLASAHAQGVLHRDIKPSNILRSTIDGEIKLLDFGLAELVEPSQRRTHSKLADRVVGTPRYLAPELRVGYAASPQSDLYSLALVLYELCMDTLPPTDRGGRIGTPLAGADAPADGSAKTVDALLIDRVPGMDPDFAKLIARCLDADPTRRLASAEALRDALLRLDRPTTAQLPLGSGNPYRGLLAFEVEHSGFFFGRDTDVHVLLQRLRRESLVMVAGDSGIGKSSLCRAGVLARVATGEFDERRHFSVLTLSPGRHPLAALGAALRPLLPQDNGLLPATDPGPWLRQALEKQHGSTQGTVLFIDQLEELLTLTEPAEAARFSEILAALAVPTAGLRVLLAVRGDFLTRLAALPGLGELIQRVLHVLRPLGPTEIREAIVGPARQLGVVFESEDLIQRLVEATRDSAGSLPLLQFALAALWEARDQETSRITQTALDGLGGVAGALARHADAMVWALGTREHQEARRLLLRLATPEGTRRSLNEAELGIPAEDGVGQAARDALVRGRLVHASAATTQPGTTYQIAHEALITHWATLRQWIDEDIGQRPLRQRVEAAAAEWERMGRPHDALWHKRQVAELARLDLASLGLREQGFALASRRAATRRRIAGWLTAAALPLLLGATYAGLQLRSTWTNQETIARYLHQSEQEITRAQAFDKHAEQLRKQALAAFDGDPRPGDTQKPAPVEDLWQVANSTWSRALEVMEQAEDAYLVADKTLAAAVERYSEKAQDRLAAVAYARIQLAERFYRADRRAELLRQLKRLDVERRWQHRLEEPAVLLLETTPPGAAVSMERYLPDPAGSGHERPLIAIPVSMSGSSPTPMAAMQLPPGSYRLRLTLPNRPPLWLPITLPPGERRSLRVSLPTTVPAGYVYIPPGWFLFGSREPESIRRFANAPPLHPVWMRQGYVIARHEVTLGDWIATGSSEEFVGEPEETPLRKRQGF